MLLSDEKNDNVVTDSYYKIPTLSLTFLFIEKRNFLEAHFFCLTSNLRNHNQHINVSINLKIELNVLRARLRLDLISCFIFHF